MICGKCGISNTGAQKFCGNCGSMLAESGGQTFGNQPPENQGQTLWQAGGQTEGQFADQSMDQGQFMGQTPVGGQFADQSTDQGQFMGQTPVGGQFAGQSHESGQPHGQSHEPGQFHGQSMGQPADSWQGQTFGHVPPPSEPIRENTNKQAIGLIIGGVVALAAIIIGVVLLLGGNAAGQMNRQLGGLDSTSYTEIREWLEDDFEEYFGEYFDLRIEAIDVEDAILGDRFLDDEERFISWSFEIDRDEEVLFIQLVYEELDLIPSLVSELEEMDRNSLREILDWIDRVEADHPRDVFLWISSVDVDGDRVGSDIIDLENEDLFEEWTFDDDGVFTIHIDLVFHTVRTFEFGDSFEHEGLQLDFYGTIRWGIVDNEFSRDFEVEYFKVPVTLTNVSSTTITSFSPRLYAPDGTQIDTLFVTGADDDIRGMGGLRPEATQRGYIFIRFYGDGDYAIELRGWPVSVEVIVPMDSSEFQDEREALLAGLEPEPDDEWDFDIVTEEDLIGRWEDGILFGIPLFVFGAADTVEFRADGTVVINDRGSESIEEWELDRFGFLHVSRWVFLVGIEDDNLFIMDDWGDLLVLLRD